MVSSQANFTFHESGNRLSDLFGPLVCLIGMKVFQTFIFCLLFENLMFVFCKTYSSWINRAIFRKNDNGKKLRNLGLPTGISSDVFDKVMLGKDYHVTDTFLDAVFSVRTQGEEAPQTFRWNVGSDADRIDANTGLFDGPAANICCENLYLESLLQHLHVPCNRMPME